MVQRPSHPTIGSGQRSYNPTHGKHKIPSHLAILIFAMVAAMIRLQSSSFVVAFRSSLSPRRRMFFLPTFVSYSESTQFGKRMCGRRLAMLPTVTPMSSASFQPTTTTYTILFDLLVPEGRCVGLSIADLPDHHPDALHVGNLNGSSSGNGHWIHQCLHPDEVSYGVSAIQSPSHRKSFWLGRLAMRHALSLGSQLQQQPYWSGTSDNSNSNPSILKDEYGRPQVPPGFLGSISHKGTTGVALVAASVPSIATANANLVPRSGVGVDLEYAIDADRRNIARKVLTPNEQANLGRIPGISKAEEVLLRFSLKESVYKAMHPLICQFVCFQEAEIQPLADGTADVLLFLKSGAHESLECVTAHWRRQGDFFLSSACARLKEKEWMARVRNGETCQV